MYDHISDQRKKIRDAICEKYPIVWIVQKVHKSGGYTNNDNVAYVSREDCAKRYDMLNENKYSGKYSNYNVIGIMSNELRDDNVLFNLKLPNKN